MSLIAQDGTACGLYCLLSRLFETGRRFEVLLHALPDSYLTLETSGG